MTHSLNRFGLENEEEIVVLCIVDEKRRKSKKNALIEAAKIILQHNPTNIQGVSPNEEIDINSKNKQTFDIKSQDFYKFVSINLLSEIQYL